MKRIVYWRRNRDYLKSSSKSLETILIILVLLFNLFLVMSKMMPDLLEINPDDGAKYVESGRLLFVWGLRNLAWGPLVAFVYAPIHIFVGNSLNWFMLEVWIGNFILFGLLWISFYILARQFEKFITKFVILGLLMTTTVFFPIIENQSDALFVVMSALSLSFVMRFKEKGQLKQIWLASLFIGLGVLSRVETILLVIPLLVFSLWLNQKRKPIYKIIMSAILPVVGVLSIFFIANIINFGHPNLGMGYKSYDSFQMNQAFFPGSKNEQAYFRGEEIFGTEEENQSSIFRAILRNPLAIIERALASLLTVPEMYLNFFGKIQGPIILFFSLYGLYHLIRIKQKHIFLLLLIWPLHAFVSLIFLPRHIIPQISYLFFVLAGVGITQLISKEEKSRFEKMGFLLAALGLSIFSLIGHKPAFLAGGLLLIVVAMANMFILNESSRGLLFLPSMILFIGLALYGYNFGFPSKTLGESPSEKAVHALLTHPDSGEYLLTSYHTVGIASKKTTYLLPRKITAPEQLVTFIRDRKIDSIYLDENMPYPSDVVDLTVTTFPEHFNLIYESSSGDIRIYTTDIPTK